MLNHSVRLLAFGFGALMFLGGLVAISAGGAAAISGIWSVAFGAAIMVATLLQRARYRSLSADRTNAAPGPGGGEISGVDPRFAPTNEVFTDPTSHLVMRVYLGPRTGERRYLAEGRLKSRSRQAARGSEPRTPGRQPIAKLRRLSRMGQCTRVPLDSRGSDPTSPRTRRSK